MIKIEHRRLYNDLRNEFKIIENEVSKIEEESDFYNYEKDGMRSILSIIEKYLEEYKAIN